MNKIRSLLGFEPVSCSQALKPNVPSALLVSVILLRADFGKSTTTEVAAADVDVVDDTDVDVCDVCLVASPTSPSLSNVSLDSDLFALAATLIGRPKTVVCLSVLPLGSIFMKSRVGKPKEIFR